MLMAGQKVFEASYGNISSFFIERNGYRQDGPSLPLVISLL